MELKKLSPALAALLLSVAVVPAYAEQGFNSLDAVDDKIDDLQDDIQEDFDDARDARKFGNGTGTVGSYGSVAMSMNATAGNSDTRDAAIGARFGFGDGVNGHDFGLTYDYASVKEKGKRSTSKNTVSGAYDYTRMFNDNLYGYGQFRGDYDGKGDYITDMFLGAGLGYRIVNNQDMTWSVQAGPGYRVANARTGNKNGAEDISEVAASLTSKLYYDLNNGMFISNVTDIIGSETNTTVTNDLGLNVSLDGPLALRTSLLSEYNSEASTDHTLGLSLVYSLK